ncbi:hypothetical protein U9M48_029441, partial [Paspalum notatum var. saurae]
SSEKRALASPFSPVRRQRGTPAPPPSQPPSTSSTCRRGRDLSRPADRESALFLRPDASPRNR